MQRTGGESDLRRGDTKMGKTLLTILIGLYLAAGVVLWLAEPKVSADDGLRETATGIHCETNPLLDIALWPLELKYHFGGGFEACMKRLYAAPTNPGGAG